MQFKTNIACKNCGAAVINAVKQKFPNAELEVDLESADKVLHVHGIPENSEYAAQVESAIKEAGFEGSWLTRGLENK